jgi:hypothetical protein
MHGRKSKMARILCLLFLLWHFLSKVGEEYIDVERHNARHFVQTLQHFVPSLLTLRSSIEVDEALQEFSAKYCQGLCIVLSFNQENILYFEKITSICMWVLRLLKWWHFKLRSSGLWHQCYHPKDLDMIHLYVLSPYFSDVLRMTTASLF